MDPFHSDRQGSYANNDRSPGNRNPLHQYHPHSLDGRCAEGQFGPSRHSHGPGAGGLLPVAALPALRSGRSHLAQPRSLRAVRRPCLHAALFRPAPGGSQDGHAPVRCPRRAGRQTRRHQAFSPTRQQMPRPSGVPLDLGRRNDNRPARPGCRQHRRHGHRRPLAGQPLQPPRFHSLRLQRLRPVRRRLHDGGPHRRSGLAGGTSQALQPVLDLRQQPHHHRGQHLPGLQRRRGHAFRWLRLGRPPGGGRQRLASAGAGLPDLPEHHGSADADHRR